MKIALINHTFARNHGGLERFSVNLAAMLRNRGHQVHLFGNRIVDIPAGVHAHTIQSAGKTRFQRLLSFQRNVLEQLSGESFDFVYALTRYAPADLCRLGDGIQRHWMRIRYPLAPWRKVNYLVNPVHLANLHLESRVFQQQNCRHIVANSRLVKEHAVTNYGISEDRVRVIYNGVDHEIFNPESAGARRSEGRGRLGLKDGDIAIVHVSNNWKRKGLDVILRAIAYTGGDGRRLHLVVVGRGKAARFAKLAERFGLRDRLHIVGPTDRVEDYYGAGDLFVLPTLYDPFANVCLEAMASGLPVITTAANGASELIRDGENGFIQDDSADFRELAGLLSRCLDGKRLKDMGMGAAVSAKPFTLERNMRETLSLCRESLGE